MYRARSFEAYPGLFHFLFLFCLGTSTAALIDASSTNINTWEYDYLVIGCGVAGLAVAGRLSEDGFTTVLCLEAGVL